MNAMQSAYALAQAELGTFEWAEGSNPKVVQYFRDAGHPQVSDDSVAWCAAFVGAMLKRAGLPNTGKLTSRSYLDWGTPVDIDHAQKGDIVVLWRGSPSSWQGHVAFFEEFVGDDVRLLGGNQRDQVNRMRYPAGRILGVRRMRRISPAQSTTLQATVAAGAATVGTVAPAVAQLDGGAQVAVIVFGVIALLALAWIARERLRKWAQGDR